MRRLFRNVCVWFRKESTEVKEIQAVRSTCQMVINVSAEG